MLLRSLASPRYLTKSRFKLAVECLRKLYYTGKPDRYPDVMADDDFLAMLAEGGYQVGALAKLGLTLCRWKINSTDIMIFRTKP